MKNRSCQLCKPTLSKIILFIWNNRERILDTPKFYSSLHPLFLFGFIYKGSRLVELGFLLENWARGKLLDTCPECGGVVLVWRSESGLTFSQFTGVCTGCHQIIRRRTNLRRELLAPVLGSESTQFSPEIKRKDSYLCYVSGDGSLIFNNSFIPLAVVYRILREGKAEALITLGSGEKYTFDWTSRELFRVDQGLNYCGLFQKDSYQNHLFQLKYSYDSRTIWEVEDHQNQKTLYELEVTDDAVYIQRGDINYLPRRYILYPDHLDRHPSGERCLDYNLDVPWQVLTLIAEGRIK
jgi:hypothetical protein